MTMYADDRAGPAAVGVPPPRVPSGTRLRYDGRVAIITGAGRGLGRQYALELAARGCRVLVNDLGTGLSGEGTDASPAQEVVRAIRAEGGVAESDMHSVTEGDLIVAAAVKHFGRVDIVINNAGVLRDVSFARMKPRDFELVMDVHVRGAFSVTHAAWPYMREAGYGRVVFVSSGSGLYGNRGQSSYAAAKAGIIGMAKTLAMEGERSGIVVNVVAPMATSRMTATVMPSEVLQALDVHMPAAVVCALCHETCTDTGRVIECGGRWAASVRVQRSPGVVLPELTPEAVINHWEGICTFDPLASCEYPLSLGDSVSRALSSAAASPSPKL